MENKNDKGKKGYNSFQMLTLNKKKMNYQLPLLINIQDEVMLIAAELDIIYN